jgi:hypothetical protein
MNQLFKTCLALLICSTAVSLAKSATPPARPNVVLIITDDME